MMFRLCFAIALLVAVASANKVDDYVMKDRAISCLECKSGMAVIIKEVGENATKTELLDFLEHECSKLGANVKALCDEAATKVASELPKLGVTLHRYGPTGLCSIIEFCKVDCCATKSKPEQVKLSYTKVGTEMAVSWISELNATDPVVRFSKAASGSTQREVGASWLTYTKGGWRGNIYRAAMSGLEQGDVDYVYQVGDKATNSWSQSFSFRSQIASAPTRAQRILMVADIGYNENAKNTVADLEAQLGDYKADYVLVSGDVSYADAYQHWWDEFYRVLEPITSHVPWMTIDGNHELPWNFLPYRSRFFMPTASLKDMDYSLNVGLVHLVSLDAETEVDEGNVSKEQIEWLRQDLQSVDRSVTPWVILQMHRPLYCSEGGYDCNQNAAHLRNQIEDILYNNHVNLVLYGHQHTYERLYATYKNQPTQLNYTMPSAPVYVLNGAAGNDEGLKHHYDQQSWSAFHLNEFGWGAITVQDAHTLKWEYFIAGQSSSGPADSFVLTR
jgi:acid phosphatase type 7